MTAEWSLIQTWETRAQVGPAAAPFAELYHRRTDPAETRHGAAEPAHAAIRARLEREIRQQLDKIGPGAASGRCDVFGPRTKKVFSALFPLRVGQCRSSAIRGLPQIAVEVDVVAFDPLHDDIAAGKGRINPNPRRGRRRREGPGGQKNQAEDRA